MDYINLYPRFSLIYQMAGVENAEFCCIYNNCLGLFQFDLFCYLIKHFKVVISHCSQMETSGLVIFLKNQGPSTPGAWHLR